MSSNKTVPNQASVEEFLETVSPDQKREDCHTLVKVMKSVTRQPPQMWGANIVGFGTYTYRYESGREGEWFLVGFAPRKQALTVYVMSGFSRYPELMKQLGPHKNGKSCLYIKKLEDIDMKVLKELVKESAAHVKKTSV